MVPGCGSIDPDIACCQFSDPVQLQRLAELLLLGDTNFLTGDLLYFIPEVIL
jgi:hypothetical protein